MNHRYSFIDLFSKKVDYDKTTQVTVSGIVIPQRYNVLMHKDVRIAYVHMSAIHS